MSSVKSVLYSAEATTNQSPPNLLWWQISCRELLGGDCKSGLE